MKNWSFILVSILFVTILFCFAQCKKERPPLNITFYNKSLPVIQFYIQGKWKLQYSRGGIAGIKVLAKYNPYIILKPNHLVIGNDSGVIVDTTLIWKQVKFSSNDSTYLLTYYYGSRPISYIIDRIQNDTLVLIDYAISDGFYHYYTKWH